MTSGTSRSGREYRAHPGAGRPCGAAALRGAGLFSSRLLLYGIAFEIAFAIAVVYLPFLHSVLGTAAVSPTNLLILLPMPVS
ncbi:cation transporting ATPase C-terminal domain-containing protein [Pseudofrankia sp. DC12]|uniref:cation transporting ATPase C-terminal domain-containing protein n=1 Tax=Pseudofrankia sp. DC12 TaxID=683315 RepID=UPI0005F7CE2D|nr:cation transporting ATPase C-terminal domain-containing protein [Pseudofrankia sp. DC12]